MTQCYVQSGDREAISHGRPPPRRTMPAMGCPVKRISMAPVSVFPNGRSLLLLPVMLGYGILDMHIELDRANSLPEESPVRDAEKRKPCGRFVRLHRPRFAMSRHRIVRAFVRWHTEASQLATYPLFLRSSTHMLDEIQNVCRLRLPHGTRDPWQRLVARDRPGCQHRSFADRGFNAITDPEWFARGFNPPVPIPDVAYRFRCAAAPPFQDFTMPNVSKATLRTRRCRVRQIEQTDRLRLLR
jgi:hypothetical protein